jgi:hypothetical protein
MSLLGVASDMHVSAEAAIRAFTSDHPNPKSRTIHLRQLAAAHASEVAGSNAMAFFVEMGSWVSSQWLD